MIGRNTEMELSEVVPEKSLSDAILISNDGLSDDGKSWCLSLDIEPGLLFRRDMVGDHHWRRRSNRRYLDLNQG
jgi:hypothetical protein